MEFSRIVCIPDLLKTQRASSDGLCDIIKEPLLQGCGAEIDYISSNINKSQFSDFNFELFAKLAADGHILPPDDLWAKTYHHMPVAAQDYLFSFIPDGALLLTSDIPIWLMRACGERNIQFLDIRLSPLKFGRDLYIAVDTDSSVLYERVSKRTITTEELRLEAAFLGASLRTQKAKLKEDMRHVFSLDNSLVYIGQTPKEASLLSSGGKVLRPYDFQDEIRNLAAGRQVLVMTDYVNAYHADLAKKDNRELSDILGVTVGACPQNIYQILSSTDSVEVFGIAATGLQEALWFNKIAHFLALPSTPLAGSGASKNNGYLQINFSDILEPDFWHQIISPEIFAPRLKRLPVLDRHYGRELLDDWNEYEKVLNWERSLPRLSFERSGGIVLRRRVSELEKRHALNASVDVALDPAGKSMKDRIRRLKDTKIGKTAYVLGNAPSLMTLDINALMMQDSFWFNKAFSLKDKGYDFNPPYYFLRDSVGFHKWGKDVVGISAGIKFFSKETYDTAGKIWPTEMEQQDAIALNVHQAPGSFMFDSDDNFSYDPSSIVYCGYTSVLDAIQVAFYMGYSRVLVGGVDLDYSLPYFYGEILPTRGGLQDFISEKTRQSFVIAKKHFEKHGRILAKITPSPNLPLNFVEDKFLLNN
jgi:hypothetical protein